MVGLLIQEGFFTYGYAFRPPRTVRLPTVFVPRYEGRGGGWFGVWWCIPCDRTVPFSALSSSSDTIETMATMMMGMLAGSAIMSFTLIWGSIIVFGSHDLSGSNNSSSSSSSASSSPFSLPKFKQLYSSSYGVQTDAETKNVASLTLLSMVPLLILQLAKILSSSTAQRIVVLIALIVTAIFLFIYCNYEVFKPWIQEKRYESLLRRHVQESMLKRYLTTAGKPNEPLIKELFRRIDKNRNKQISENELYAFILGVQIEEAGFHTDDSTQRVMKEFDLTQDSQISEKEFIQGISKWLDEAMVLPSAASSRNQRNASNNTSQGNMIEEQQSLISQDENGTTPTTSTSTTKPSGKAWWNYTKAGSLIILGTGIMILIGMPLMVNIQSFATAVGIPSFLVTYVVVPLSMGYRQVIAAVTSARKKTVKDISLSFSEIYNGVFMNNLMGLATFLLLVYIKDITWDVSAEVLLVLLICTLMGCLSSLVTKFPLWIGLLAYILYPVSLILLYVLTSVFGWS
ncbi:hypothetical protein CRG98_017792 [Punica granatum]|uniref:EF-hand domain-containing protein n=1 Tax=Punica granatum TaxID=22663 RepID=A0A2I0JZT9_PUNGR|nr:hypothetical protein CRG98_017792 [Punica granatum]